MVMGRTFIPLLEEELTVVILSLLTWGLFSGLYNWREDTVLPTFLASLDSGNSLIFGHIGVDGDPW